MGITNRDHKDILPVAPIIEQPHTYETISDSVGSVILSRPQPIGWFIMLGIGLFFVSILGISTAYLFLLGTGVWAVNIPVAWGFAIVNFVWWIGIGHAGTLISAILLLLRQEWEILTWDETWHGQPGEPGNLPRLSCADTMELSVGSNGPT